MKKIFLTTAALLAVSVLPLSAQTQTRPPQPNQEVGGAAGSLSGGNVGNAPPGTISADDRLYVRERLMRQNVPSASFEGNVTVGAELPGTVRYYQFENEPRFTNYRYTRLNNRYVLVNSSNRVVAVIE